jgi:hypothetical protein
VVTVKVCVLGCEAVFSGGYSLTFYSSTLKDITGSSETVINRYHPTRRHREYKFLVVVSLWTYVRRHVDNCRTFSVAFAKLRKGNISFVMSVRPSARVEQLGSHLTHFNDIWTDMTKLILAFRNFENSPKNPSLKYRKLMLRFKPIFIFQ